MANIYPSPILDRLISPTHAGRNENANAVGKSVALECGTFIEFQISIKQQSKLIETAAFRSNGCGYMIAAADLLARKLKGTNLTELHALADNLDRLITTNLDVFPAERQHCSESVIAALKDAFADFRQKQIEEFAGEKALICTCFGVTEDTIESAVTENSASTVSQVGQLCKAGLGCGSCQMMIQEIIDSINCVK